MKKMNAVAVLVVLMSATSAFAERTCAEINSAIWASKNSISQSTKNITILDDRIPQIHAEIIKKQSSSKDDSLILGNGQELLQEEFFQTVKARANEQARILQEEERIQSSTAEYLEQCSSFDKFE
ncbi:hypothetical protein D3C87_1137020 [compost metagenome]